MLHSRKIKVKSSDALKEENKKLKLEKEHLKIGLSKFTRGKHLQSELLMNTVMKMDRSGIGYLANQEKKAQAQQVWVAKSLVEKVKGPQQVWFLKLDLLCVGELRDRWKSLGY